MFMLHIVKGMSYLQKRVCLSGYEFLLKWIEATVEEKSLLFEGVNVFIYK